MGGESEGEVKGEEADRQIQAGYFSKKEVTDDVIAKTKGRNWGKSERWGPRRTR